MQSPYSQAAFKQNRHRRPRQRTPPTIDVLPGQVSFRVVCHVSSIGGVIGSSGAIVSQFRRETSSRIHCEEPVRGSDHRVILIIGSGSIDKRIRLSESEECDVSSAQEAMIRVFERLWAVEAERECGGAAAAASDGYSEDAYCGLLANTTQIGAVVGRGGKSIVRMRQESGAKIRILPPPPCGRKDDELIQITGGNLAVKKALIAVSACLQDCPPLDRDLAPSSRPPEKASFGASIDPHAEFFPHLSSLLTSKSLNSVSTASNAHMSSTDTDKDAEVDAKGTKKEVIFRLLCSNGAAGAIIGKKGAIVRALQDQSGASIMFAPPLAESGERVVTISALENLESWYSSAQDAVVLVFARSVEADVEKGLRSGLRKGIAVTARLLVAADLVSCLNDTGGWVLSEIIEHTGANVQILEENLIFDQAPQNVVQITGEYNDVQNALFQVTSRLRENLWLPKILDEVKASRPFGRARETVPLGMHQPESLPFDTDKETCVSRGMDPGVSGSGPPKLQPQGSTIFGRNSELERSLDYLLPREVLNEVGGRSPYRGAGETTSSGLPQSLRASCDSDQENNLARGINRLRLSDNIGTHISRKLQPLQTVGHRTANADGVSVEIESGRKSAVIKNTTVEILVAEDVFGSVYGKDGRNLAYLRQISGAKVEVHDPSPGESEGTVVISGTPDQTQAAQSVLQAFIIASQ